MIDTNEIRAAFQSAWVENGGDIGSEDILALCDALDATRAALEAQRQLHANLLAHLRWRDGR